jgi:outer membrane cobalamin receptor
MTKKAIITTLLVYITSLCHAQKIVVSGRVIDSQSNEKLSGVQILVIANGEVVRTNKYGYFAISVSKGEVRLSVHFIEYRSQEIKLTAIRDTSLLISLKKLEYDLNEVTITSPKNMFSENNENFTIPIQQIKKAPALLGEVDVLKSLQFLPGVQQGTEGTAGLHIRGGSPDQTLILIDGVPVYNVYHLFGFFSVFNPDAISNVKLYKNELPARYGGRLSAVVDIETKEGNQKQFQRSFSVSPISGKFTIEGPIKKNRSSFILSARKTWLDLITTAIQKIASSNAYTKYGFYDLNAKLNYKLDSTNHLYLSYYMGRDAFKNSYSSGRETANDAFDWGNYTAILRWNQTVSQQLFQNTTLSFTNYDYAISSSYQSGNNTFESKTTSKIRDFQVRTDWDYFTNSNNLVNFGLGFTIHQFRPEVLQTKGDFLENIVSNNPENNTNINDLQAYIQKEFKPFESLTINIGGHYNALLVNQKFYNSFQPRASVVYSFKSNTNLRASFFNTFQYLHLLTNSSLGLPIDLWVPVTEKVPPQQANQISVGVSHQFKKINIAIDGYYKAMTNLIEYKEGATFLNDLSARWYDKIAIGKGYSKGVEVFIQKNTGKTQGFLSYTLSWTNRIFEELNNGKTFPYKYDRRHNISLNLTHNFTKNRQISITFSLLSGSLTSLPISKYQGVLPPADDRLIPPIKATYDNYLGNFADSFNELGAIPYRNNFRLPLYHRLDVNYQSSKKTKKGQRKWGFSVYNLYNRANPFYIYYQAQQLSQFSLFPILPSVSYEYSF